MPLILTSSPAPKGPSVANVYPPSVAESTPRPSGRRQLNPHGRTRWVPGEIGIWAFVFTDLIVFSFYFGTFCHERSRNPGVFARDSGALNAIDGVMNCGFLLTASLFVALAVQAVNAGKGALARRYMLGAGLCGVR